MTIDSRLQATHILPVSYDPRLPERYVHSPVRRMQDDDAHPYRTVIDVEDCYDGGQSLNYTQDAKTGAVKAVSIMSLRRKGTLVDTLA